MKHIYKASIGCCDNFSDITLLNTSLHRVNEYPNHDGIMDYAL